MHELAGKSNNIRCHQNTPYSAHMSLENTHELIGIYMEGFQLKECVLVVHYSQSSMLPVLA